MSITIPGSDYTGPKCPAEESARRCIEGRVVEMCLCEIPWLVLHAGPLYRFVQQPGCQACADYAAGGRHSDEAGELEYASWFPIVRTYNWLDVVQWYWRSELSPPGDVT